jgi:hypothetical protein
MKTKITLLSLFFCFAISTVNAQVKGPSSIISTKASMKKYYDKAELDGMQKGQLLELYIERIKVLVNTLPYIALTSKPGVTLADVGIPDSPDTTKKLNSQIESTTTFLDQTVEFQKSITPYADKGNLVKAILYYQDMLKQLHQLEE